MDEEDLHINRKRRTTAFNKSNRTRTQATDALSRCCVVQPFGSKMDEEKRIGLTWLANTVRNLGLVDASAGLSFWEDQLWARGLASPFEITLDYEPRSLAFSADGECIAVGTKTGAIQTIRLNQQLKWAPESVARYVAPEGERRCAVRSLAFLDNRGETLLAGYGNGSLAVVDVASGRVTHAHRDQVDASSSDWFGRFEDLLPLGCNDDGEAVALGITPSRNLHVLYREGDDYVAKTILPEDVLHQWPRGARLVGGSWYGATLWLLAQQPDGSGLLWRYGRAPAPVMGSGPTFPPEAQYRDRVHTFHLPPAPTRPQYRALRACSDGIGIQAGRWLTIMAVKDGVPSADALEWLEKEDVVDFTLLRPFRHESRASETNPLWMVLATGRSTSWHGWTVDARTRSLHPSERPPLESPVGAPSRQVLRIAARFLTPNGEPETPYAACYLVRAYRDHRLCITSLVDMNEAPTTLWDHLQDALKSSDTSFAEIPGVRLWLARRLLYRDFGLDPKKTLPAVTRAEAISDMLFSEPADAMLKAPSLDDPPVADWLVQLEAVDIRQLARDLIRAVRAAQLDLRTAEQRGVGHLEVAQKMVVRACQNWTLMLLNSAVGLSGSLPGTIAQQIVEGFKRRGEGSGLETLDLLAARLQKWICFGHTYGSKSERLLEIARWNAESKRAFDTLAYTTRLIHQRVDLISSSELPVPSPNPAVFCIVTHDGTFTVQSHADGRISACTASGQALAWTGETLNNPLQLASDGLSLVHRQTEAFVRQYGHGPYARRLHLSNLGQDRYLLVFGIKGWRDFHREAKAGERAAPHFCALLFQRQKERPDELQIIDSSTQPTEHELYAIALINQRQDKSGTATHEYVIGTNQGDVPFIEREVRVNQHQDESGTAQPNQEDLTFAESEEVLSDTVQILEETYEPESKTSIPAEHPSITEIPEVHHNRAWSIAFHQEEETQKKWLWVGLDDGQVRAYFREAGSHKWDELDGLGRRAASDDEADADANAPEEASDADLDEAIPAGADSAAVDVDEESVPDPESLAPRRLSTGNPVSALCCVAGELLAYGNANGTIGVVPLRHKHRSALLIHTREGSAVSGLHAFQDETTSGDRGWRLLATTRQGTFCVYDVDLSAKRPLSLKRRTTKKNEPAFQRYRAQMRHRRAPAGTRLDHFRALRTARSSALLAIDRSQVSKKESALLDPTGPALPLVVIGSDDGQVRRYALLAPKTSLRRETLANESLKKLQERAPMLARKEEDWETVFQTSVMHEAVGSERRVLDFLRLANVGGLHLKRFALWVEIRLAADKIDEVLDNLPSDPEEAEAEIKRVTTPYRDLLRRLADEAYRTKPFNKEMIKQVWFHGVRVANDIAACALLKKCPCPGALLKEYRELIDELGGFSNRWIGKRQEMERTILVHAFAAIIDYPDTLLIATPPPSEDVEEIHRSLRNVLLRNIVQRRLHYDDALVPLEALRILNLALFRSIDRLLRTEQALATTPMPAQKTGLGFMELMTMVGRLARRHSGLLLPDDPLTTEIAQFFALSLLLMKDAGLSVCVVVSECRLTEHRHPDGEDIAKRVDNQAQLVMAKLRQLVGLKQKELLEAEKRVERFSHYLRDKLDARKPRKKEFSKYSDAGIELELWHVQKARKELELLPLDDRKSDPRVNDLEALFDLVDVQYFTHSISCFRELKVHHDKVWEAIAGNDLTAADEVSDEAESYVRACDLYEPQRGAYLAMVRSWRRSAVERFKNNRDAFEEIAQTFEETIRSEQPWPAVYNLFVKGSRFEKGAFIAVLITRYAIQRENHDEYMEEALHTIESKVYGDRVQGRQQQRTTITSSDRNEEFSRPLRRLQWLRQTTPAEFRNKLYELLVDQDARGDTHWHNLLKYGLVKYCTEFLDKPLQDDAKQRLTGLFD